MKRVELQDFRENPEEVVLEAMRTGETFYIWNGNRPFAILRPVPPEKTDDHEPAEPSSTD